MYRYTNCLACGQQKCRQGSGSIPEGLLERFLRRSNASGGHEREKENPEGGGVTVTRGGGQTIQTHLTFGVKISFNNGGGRGEIV